MLPERQAGEPSQCANDRNTEMYVGWVAAQGLAKAEEEKEQEKRDGWRKGLPTLHPESRVPGGLE